MLDFPLCYMIAIQIARALEFLHSHNFIHRDIKSSNVLLGKGYSVKLIDFGCTRIANKDSNMTGAIGYLIKPCTHPCV